MQKIKYDKEFEMYIDTSMNFTVTTITPLVDTILTFEDIDYTISNQIAKSFIAFAKTGNPNCNAIPKWESGSKKIMTFCEDTKSKAWMTKKLIKNTIHGGFEV